MLTFHLCIFFGKMSAKVFGPFIIALFFLLLSFKSSLCFQDKFFYQMFCLKIFSPRLAGLLLCS